MGDPHGTGSGRQAGEEGWTHCGGRTCSTTSPCARRASVSRRILATTALNWSTSVRTERISEATVDTSPRGESTGVADTASTTWGAWRLAGSRRSGA